MYRPIGPLVERDGFNLVLLEDLLAIAEPSLSSFATRVMDLLMVS
jgi:hypothetical protein